VIPLTEIKNSVERITSNFTVQQMIERICFKKDLKKNEPFICTNFYTLWLKLVDSVEMDVDLEIGGMINYST